MMKRIAFAVLGFGLAIGVLAPRGALADKVVLKSGRVIEGKIVDESDTAVKIESRGGIATIERGEIKEVVKDATLAEKWEKAIAAASKADDLLKIADEAKATAPKTAQKAWEKAIKLDPENARAREALGFKKVDGKWVSDAELKKKSDADKTTGDYKKELEGTGGWFYVESKRYKIKCNSTKDVADRYAAFLERIRDEYERVFKGRKHYWDGQSLVYIWKSNEEFKEYNPQARDRGVGGFYRSKSEEGTPDRIVCAFHGAFGTGDTRTVLAHECTHQFEHILCDGDWLEFYLRPAWWMEGYATYFGDGAKLDSKKAGSLEIQIPRMRLDPIQDSLKRNQIQKKLAEEGDGGEPTSISHFMKWGLREYQSYPIAYPFGWSLIYYFHKRCEVPGKKKGSIEYKPIKIKVDGKEREVNLYEVINKYFDVIAKKPPPLGNRETGEGMDRYGDHYLTELTKLLGFSPDELYEDWKEFTLKLEPPSMGKIDKARKKFSGAEAGLEVELPSIKGWTWNEKDCGEDEAIRLDGPEGVAEVRIKVDGNMENNQLFDEAGRSAKLVDDVKARLQYTFHCQTFDVDEKTTAAGISSAWQLVYDGVEQRFVPGQKVRDGDQRVWHIIIGGREFKRTYQIVCIANKDKFEENKPAFDKIVNSFKMLKDN